jgi:hypothetical protein
LRKPSRYMPPAPTSGWGDLRLRDWLALVGVVAFLAWLLFWDDIWFGILMSLYLSCLYLWAAVSSRRYESRMRNTRNSDSIRTFAKSFDFRSVDTWVIRAVYEGFQTQVSFPIRPDDHISDDLWLDDEDIEADFVRGMAFRCRRSLDDPKSNPHYPLDHTLRNLVHFLDAQPIQASA